MYLIITLLTNFIWLTSVDNFDFDQVLKDFKLFRDEYPRLFRKKVKELILKPSILVQNHYQTKTDLKIYWLIEFYFTGISIWINIRLKIITKRWKANRNLDWLNKSNHCHSSRRKEAVSEIQSDLENRVYHDQEGDKGSFLEVSTWTHKSPLTKEKHQINTYLKDIISTVTDSDELYILALLRLKQS
jgi:hypothetical protein